MFQFQIEVTDLGIPKRKSDRNANIQITVVRNVNSPRFSNLPSSVTVSENTTNNSEIYKVDGRDSDTITPFNQLSYSIVGDDNAPIYFGIDQEGRVTVKTDLKAADGFETQYKVKY